MIFFSRKTQTPEAFGWFIPTVKKKTRLLKSNFLYITLGKRNWVL